MENLPSNDIKPSSFTSEMSKMVQTAGTIQLSKEQMDALYAPIDDIRIQIRPDGLIYLPWYEYAKRLNDAFTPFGWSLVPLKEPYIDGTMVYWWFALMVNGKFCGSAIGGQEFIPANKTMNYGDCCEAAKSNALTRICKERGFFNKMWDKDFGEAWKAKYAVITGTEMKGDKKVYRYKKKDDFIQSENKLQDSSIPVPENAPEAVMTATVIEPKPEKTISVEAKVEETKVIDLPYLKLQVDDKFKTDYSSPDFINIINDLIRSAKVVLSKDEHKQLVSYANLKYKDAKK